MRLFTTTLLLLTSLLITAQANWQSGYIIKNGERITGEIDDREWPYHIDKITFRTKASGTSQSFNPKDGIDFEVAGRRYVSKSVPVIANSRDLDKLTVDTSLTRRQETGFLRLYLDGDLGLYQYIDQRKKRHFYAQKKASAFTYLEYERHLRPNSEKNILLQINKYKFQLSELLSGCPQLSADIAGTEYSLKSLKKLILKWYECQGVSPTYKSKASGGKLSFGPAAHLVSSHLSASFSSNRGTKSSEPHLGPALGAAARYTFPSMQGRFSIKTDIVYHSFDEASQSLMQQDGPISITFFRELSQSSIQASFLADYQIFTGKIPVYAELGMVTDFILDLDFKFSEIRILTDGTETAFTSSANRDLEDGNNIGFAGGLGIYLGNLQLGLRASRVTREKTGDSRVLYRASLIAGYWF